MWDAWTEALRNPADNVVAAVIVLVGVAVTAIVTVLVAWRTRVSTEKTSLDRLEHERAEAARTRVSTEKTSLDRLEHERAEAARERLFKHRADAYLDAGATLLQLQHQLIRVRSGDGAAEVPSFDTFMQEQLDRTNRLKLYGTERTDAAFQTAVAALLAVARAERARAAAELDKAKASGRAPDPAGDSPDDEPLRAEAANEIAQFARECRGDLATTAQLVMQTEAQA